MSNIKKFFSKLKSEVKFSKAGEGHRLNEPSSAPPRNVQSQTRAQPTIRQNSDGGAAARAAAIAAQQRLQQQTVLQNSAAASENKHIFRTKYKKNFLYNLIFRQSYCR